ncbi:aminopeptidase [Adlercreutzia muris]|uniref:Aminopeptidase n=1 Tax=Adlercreutzia muris TaxID=1796610 RepID=A0A7C8FWA8_9ACTN|nr:aminopeptidase [Adlercreutzia muris]KAB1645866.1 aminopeptidase [Adlercreutzia muris]MCR2028198.1 aminopeptidase [Adlercreutzia muris]NCA31719.1 aminopeptidase [Adlercreutzia muris]
MAELNECVAYLSQEIGPRPAGTEEEQRAALYISETLSAETGLPTTMEDFQCNPDSTLPRALVGGVAVLMTLVATIFSVVSVASIVIGFLCVLLLAAEIFDKPVLSRLLNRGASQNVVAKYVPLKSAKQASRRRKVIIVAHYDSGKIRRDLNSAVITALPLLYWVEFAAMVLMPVLLLVRMIVTPADGALIAFNVALAVAMAVAVLPTLSFALEKLSTYNDGANCNASGVAVLLDVAARVAASRDIPDGDEPLIHGAAAAASAGLVPEGAELVYDVPSNTDELDSSMESAAERLAAAKAAVAALSGKPVAETEAVTSPASDPEEEAPAPACPDPAPALEAEPPTASPVIVPVQAPAPAIEPAVPDWFKKGQEQAKKPKVEKPVQRSRYAAALERAEEEITAREESQKSATEELSARMRGMRASVQAASAAAGAQPTGVIADLPPLEESPAAVAAPSVEPQVAPVAPVLADTPIPATEEAPVPPAVAAAVPEEVLTPSPADIPSPLDRSAAVDLSQVPAVAADDPDVVLREGQRPLTGATVAAPPVGASPLAGIPTPADQAAEGSRRLVIPSVGEIPPVVEGASDSSPRKRRAISLPNIGISQELPRISMDDHLQAAPLAEERPAHDGRVRDLSAIVPSVASPATPPAAPHSAALRDALPSLSQVPAAADPGLSGSINLAGSFSAMGATGAAAPLTDDMFEAASEDDLYIEDVDDSAYMEQVTETGAMAGPGYVEMPKSRFGRIFGKRRRHAQVEASTPQEWLDVEDTFDAREAGAARGGWESFREEDEFDGYDEDFDPRQTTAFSPDFGENQSNAAAPLHRRGRHFEGGAFSRGTADGEEPFDEEESRPRREAVSSFADGLPAGFVFDDAPEAAAIEQFHSKRIDMEVWFVALGSELAGNGGMRAFMETHEAELKGSIIIELEALGAGELTLMDREGTYLPKKASSRMKRLVRKAGQAVGLSVGDGTMEWRDSASAYAMKHGQQAMHLAGMEGKKPTFFGEADDVLENVDGDQLALNSDFVMELLKQI